MERFKAILKKCAPFSWHFLFVVLLLISTWYLIAHRGIWEFTDSGFFYRSLDQAYRMAWSKLYVFSNTDGFSLGFDNSSRSFAHLLVSWYQWGLIKLFGSDVGQIVYYTIYYLLCFVFSQRLLKTLLPTLDKSTVRLGGLFAAFNPFSLLIITLFATGYVYACTFILFDAVLRFQATGRRIYLLLGTVAGMYAFTYLRLLPLLVVLAVVIFFLFRIRLTSIRRVFGMGIVIFLCSLPFWVGTLSAFTQSDNILNNYQSGFAKYDVANYTFKESFVNAFSFTGGFTPSALSFAYNPKGLTGFADNFADLSARPIFAIVHLVSIAALLMTMLLVAPRRPRTYGMVFLCLSVLAVNAVGFFVSFPIFQQLHKTVLVFLYNDYGFTQFIEAFLLVFMVATLSTHLQDRSKKIFQSCVVIFLLVNTFPLLGSTYGLKKIAVIPEEYRQTLITDKSFTTTETSLFAPYHWVKFGWAPYFLDMNFFGFSSYQSLITPNLRIVGGYFTDFFNDIYQRFEDPHLGNIALFNMKNIFLLKDVQTSNNTIDTYHVNDLEKIRDKYQKEIEGRKDLSVVQTNDRFAHYRLPDTEGADRALYIAGDVKALPLDHFYDQSLNLSQNPVLIDDVRALNTLDTLFQKTPTSQEHLFYKGSLYDPTVYFVKITDLNLAKGDMFIQLNQTYGSAWNLYFIDSSLWDRVPCAGGWVESPQTRNASCSYQPDFLQANTLRGVQYPILPQAFHIRSNYIGNGFLLTKDSVPETLVERKEIYVMIFFKKQIYYQISLIFSAVFLVVLGFLALLEEIPRKTRHKTSYESS